MILTALSQEFTQRLTVDGVYDSRRWKKRENQEFKARLMAAEMPGFETFEERVAALRFNLAERPVCAVCCGRVKFDQSSANGFRRTCSVACAARDPVTKQKIRTTQEEKYGGHPMHNAEVVAKMVESMHASDAFKRSRDTLEYKTGSRSVFSQHGIKEKIAETNTAKYGVANPMQNSEIAARAGETVLKRHGSFFNKKLKRR